MGFCLDNSKINLDENISKLRKHFKSENIPVILDEGLNMLLMQVKIKRPDNILEIGTAVGLSGSAMLMSYKNAKLTTIEKNEKCCELAAENFKRFNVDKRVKLLKGDAMDEIKKLDAKFDFIFLDGAKSQYKNYLETLVNLLNTGGVLFCDNVLFRGYVSGETLPPKKYNSITNNLKIFLKMLKEEKRLETVLLNIGDGVSISIKNGD